MTGRVRLAALDDPDSNNPLAIEISVAIAAYGQTLSEQATRAGCIPDTVVLPSPQNEIAAFALELFMHAIGSMGIRVTLHGDNVPPNSRA